jgi:predicted GNAT family N-acyltransferase
MATTLEARGTGAGRAMLEACLAHVAHRGGRRVWCNARLPAAGFYERFGFVVESDVFELPDSGPHVVMSRRM